GTGGGTGGTGTGGGTGGTGTGGTGTGGPTNMILISDQVGYPRIYKMPIAGGTETLIDTASWDPQTATVNRTQDTVVFAAITYTVQLYQMTITGGGLTAITDGSSDAMWPCFSADGLSILYTDDATGVPQLYVMPVGGGSPTQLTNLANGATMGRFSPNGTKIVFVSGATNDDVFIMNADGSGVTQLTSGAQDENQPCFSPDGTKIVWVKDMGGVAGVNGQLWEMSINGSGPFQLTTTLQDDEEPCYTPDGKGVLFSRASGSGRELYKIPPAGGAATRITNDGATASSPATGW
ncbi:MAG: TolB family protein, partial [Fimbriimonadales bacterium]